MTVLPRVDQAPIEYDEFSDEFKRWLANLVDTINTALEQIEPLI